MIYIKSLPGEVTTLKDALDQAKVFTGTFIESAVKILNQSGINKDVSVWAQILLKGVTPFMILNNMRPIKKIHNHIFCPFYT
jgi:hypothetical protein